MEARGIVVAVKEDAPIRAEIFYIFVLKAPNLFLVLEFSSSVRIWRYRKDYPACSYSESCCAEAACQRMRRLHIELRDPNDE